MGQGASYSLIEDRDTEHAYDMVAKQQGSVVILPDGVQQNVFMVIVADNIDRREETCFDCNDLT
jgi:hypothetical protein